METRSIDIVKYMLFIFNVIFGITGVALIIIGTIIIVDLGRFSNYLSVSITAPPILFIILGIFIIATSIFGIYCIDNENENYLIVFSILLLSVLLMEIFLVIMSSISKDNFNNNLRFSLKTSMGKYSFDENDRQSWATVQRKLECCGIDTPRDWSIIFPENLVPVTCCQNLPIEVGALCRNLFDDRIIYQKGCYNILSNRVRNRLSIVMYIALAFALLQFIGVVLSCSYFYMLKNDEDDK